jgi:hypothetical protein
MRSLTTLTTLALAISTASASVIDTGAGNTAVGQLIESNGSTVQLRGVGQTFRVPAPTEESILTEIRFETLGSPYGSDFDFGFYLYEWNAAIHRTSGPALFASGHLNTAIPPTRANLTIPIPEIQLDPAKSYIAFLTTAGVADEAFGLAYVIGGSLGYVDGSSHVLNVTNHADAPVTETWSTPFAHYDLNFRAVFVEGDVTSPVPEPASVGLLCSALAIGWWRYGREMPGSHP